MHLYPPGAVHLLLKIKEKWVFTFIKFQNFVVILDKDSTASAINFLAVPLASLKGECGNRW